ncbi:putative membrane protein [Acinetobacter sp. 1130196]|nr:hypothetical protein ACINWC487_1125 [Acinetobacter nosocomialis]EXB09090.1 putative membrane protein [Acinetobacter sp. 1396970]EXE99118.1 putative membrane protein [Acinetobacter sp. 259052]EXI11753.1 putative membrane protein [Acinetobacter sp. 694762]EXR17535.1 putative membrane protein [Acinetobacter sp. 1130196]EXS48026.1 putative membrane protein [Acinetobacter sp. 88816]EYT20948.1 putative membrane protein [Acinetobacter sp. 1592897]KCX90985.1 putative membrane protein [Acinetobact
MTKAIVAIGVLCLVAYLLTISYIPSEISFGDTLIFLLIFAAFSIVYTAFCMMLFFFGISLLPVTYFILSVVDRYLPSHIKIGEKLPFPKISIITLGVSVYLLYIIRGLFFLDWKINAYIGITISLISFSYYAFYVNQKRVKEYRLKFENLREIIDDPKASKNLKNFAETKLKQLEIWIKNSIQSALFLILTPLIFMSLIEDVGKIFLYYTMEKTGVRIEKATLYIKEPYANLIELPQTTTKELNQYKTFIFKDVKVLFQGIGKSTLVSYKVKDIEKQLVIPNEYITVERSKKIEE